jgi:hypothetical protein
LFQILQTFFLQFISFSSAQVAWIANLCKEWREIVHLCFVFLLRIFFSLALLEEGKKMAELNFNFYFYW